MNHLLAKLTVATALSVTLCTQSIALELSNGHVIRSYASADPDSVNSHLIETPEGVVVIGAQRTFSEAERALARVERTGKPVLAVIISVPHTDHYGGLARWRDAFPDAQVIAAEATLESMRTDGEGYIASRKEALGDDFPSQAEVDANLPATIVVDGQEITIDGLRMVFHDLPGNNAPTNTMVQLPDHEVLFTSEVVEDGITAFLKDADLDLWIAQVTALPKKFPDVRVFYPAHGNPGPPEALIEETLAHLSLYRDGIDAALESDQVIDEGELAELTARIETAYPDYAQVARVPREALVFANIEWQAARRVQTP